MKTAGIDIGTTTISGIVLEKEENGQAKILEAKTVENGCFIETGNEWERIQYAKEIVERAVNLLDYFLEKYPHVERIGLTGRCMELSMLTKKEIVSVIYMAGCQRKYLLWCSEGNEYRIVSDVYDYSERNWYKNQTHDWFREWTEKKSGTVRNY